MTNTGDITGRKSAEEQIRFQARLLDAVGQAIIATNTQGRIIYWNRAAEELYGWSKEEVMGRPIVEVTPSEEMLERAEEIMSELSAGRSWSGEFVVQRKDGSTFSAMVSGTPVHDEQGNLEGIIGVSTDITEIKKMEELRRSEERFRLLAENAKDIIYRYRLKPTPGFEYVSPSATPMTGYTPEEHYADPELGLKLVYPDDRHVLEAFLRSPESADRFLTVRWISKDGRIIWTEQQITPFYDDQGELVAIDGIGRDITERKEAEDSLRRSEERFRSLVQNASDIIIILEADGTVRYVSPAIERVLGLQTEEVIGKNAVAFVDPVDRTG